MWLSKFNTKEKMDNGSERVVPAKTPFLSKRMLTSPNIKRWANYVDDNSEAAEAGREYLKSIEAEKEVSEDIEDAEDAEFEEVKEVIDEKTEPVKETDSEDVEKVETEVDLSKYDTMKNNELKALLKEAKIEYKNSMNGTMLKTLCAENKL